MNQLSWTTVLTGLVLASTTAYLVIVNGWSYLTTVLIVSGTVIALALFMTALLLLISPKAKRGIILSIIFEEFRKERKLILSMIWRK